MSLSFFAPKGFSRHFLLDVDDNANDDDDDDDDKSADEDSGQDNYARA